MTLIIEGNDGTGKSTLVAKLRAWGYDAADRGIMTRMTDNPSLSPSDDEFYILLDAPVIICRERLKRAGKDLNERYHTIKDLTFYRDRFLDIAKQIGSHHSAVVDASGPPEKTFEEALKVIQRIST